VAGIEAAPGEAGGATAPRVTWRSHYTLAVISLIYVSNHVDRQIMAILIEPIKREFGASDTAMGLLTGLVFALFYATLGIPVGRYADRHNRKTVVAACCAFWSTMTMLCGMAGSFVQLALARIGVAVGESGASAPSLSAISDLYPREWRSLAISVFQCGPSLGLVMGLGVGGWIAQHYGWRTALLAAGGPGVVLAAVLWLTTREPLRGGWEGSMPAPVADQHRSLFASLRALLSVSAFRWVIFGYCVTGISGYAIATWNPSYLVRTHGLSTQQAGLLLGVVGGILSTAGTLFCGWLADRLVSRDPRWQLGVPILGICISVPFGLAFFLWPPGTGLQLGSLPVPTALFFYLVFGFFGSWWAAPLLAATTKLFDAHHRGLATAVLLMAMTLIGTGGGPLLAGAASDLLAAAAGQQSLGYALALLVALQLIAVAGLAVGMVPYRAHMAATSGNP
jgi:MFS family permease